MKTLRTLFPLLSLVLSLLVAVPLNAQSMNGMSMGSKEPRAMATPAQMQERLGTVSFPVSCAAGTQVYFDRGVALLHDFWYEEARSQFERIAKADPACAMAHWGVVMSGFHQIWDRPDPESMKVGWEQMQAAEALPVKTAREKAYIAALADFYKPGAEEFPARIHAYSAAMGRLYAKYPGDVDAGAFYALSLLAEKSPTDMTQAQEQKAMVVLKPLLAKDPDDPGVVHYIIHSCDNPPMAKEGLAAADHYGEIAQSGPHAFHMPGHIYSRLGMWPQDIASQEGSIKASREADARGESGILDEPHSYDFLIYAELQSGQDMRAKQLLAESRTALDKIAAMQNGGMAYMAGMIPYYRVKLAGFYALEMHDWKTAAAMKTVKGASDTGTTLVYWVRVLGDGQLKDGRKARANLAQYDALIDTIRKGNHAYEVEGTGTTIERDEMVGWTAYAEGDQAEALRSVRAAADLQDKVGQGEVDIPAREMLANMLLEVGKPKAALAEYVVALRLSPDRLNGLYGAAQAAEAAGEKTQARMYYTALLKSTKNGIGSARPEFAHAKSYVAQTEKAGD
jgi:tetratricopeptide (TPR) repeat protein